MVTVKYKFATGNCMIQYAAAYVLALKHNLKFAAAGGSKSNQKGVKGIYINWQDFFQIDPPKTGREFDITLTINQCEYLKYLNNEKEITTNLELHDYFQTKAVVYDYRKEILSLFTKNLKYNKQKQSEVFVHYRLDDIINTRSLVPKEYYIEALTKINPTGGIISSDTIDHPWVNEISTQFNLQKYVPESTSNILEIINIAKDFNNLVVGEGTFGWWMAFLSRASNIYYNKRKWRVGGNSLWSFPEWNYFSWDWKTEALDPSNNNIRLKYLPETYKM